MRSFAFWFLVLVAGVALIVVTWRGAGPAPAPGAHPIPPGPVRVFLILPGDEGRHGAEVACADSLIAYAPSRHKSARALYRSLTALLRIPPRPDAPPGAYNALGASSLRVRRASVHHGTADIDLVGEFNPEGRCDGVRARAQLDATVRQFPGVRIVNIRVNGRPLGLPGDSGPRRSR